MSSEPTEEEVVQGVYEHAANLMMEGKSRREIVDDLMEKGLDEQSASAVVTNLKQMRKEAGVGQGRKNMLFGALWCIGGTVVTVATYSAAGGGGTYVVAWVGHPLRCRAVHHRPGTGGQGLAGSSSDG